MLDNKPSTKYIAETIDVVIMEHPEKTCEEITQAVLKELDLTCYNYILTKVREMK